ncbi:CDP-paratose 2-epimerase [Azospirillum sp. OGB3]|uniref:GDP-mannose 4,6-dehydratase n=1 Tax=Azospirillum sp. OGB3 TaxID=2587012 RepID=UPI001605A1E6|nr:GDP-mannose 4,6-dehydratase [Azospirillum sp. OGB3]MBB3264556.1 CDP-paratose 2-epimerase [Azospirillum sp. OGB3]
MEGKTLVTGGAGFVGCNLVKNLLEDGRDVVVLDALLRPGSERNAAWLQTLNAGSRLTFMKADVRDFTAVKSCMAGAEEVYHLAGQVAVTSSLDDPRTDFDINALGTFNVLEAARRMKNPPKVVFTSTNKVYGGLEHVAVEQTGSRYRFVDRPLGVSEAEPLDFHSPYGCSKGAADQYVRDYARIYDLPTVVFRMSCIYGPRQFGNEDQGWVAHFIISALSGRPIHIYGDGMQVRDVLFVEDLVRAFRLATEKIEVSRGQVFNIGGGPENTISVWREFGEMLSTLRGKPVEADFSDWRPGDQPCYVSDIRKAEQVLGWRPQVDRDTGIRRLWDWADSYLAQNGLPTDQAQFEPGRIALSA